MSAAARSHALIPFASPRTPQRVALPDPQAELQAQTRLAIIQPILEYRSGDPRFARLRLKDGTPVTSLSRMVAYTSEVSGQSERWLYKWLRAYKQGGRPALAGNQRRDSGTSRFFDNYPKAKWLAAYMYLECRQSCRAAHEALLRHADLVEVPAEELPTYETVRAWLRSMPPSLEIYARQGRKAYRERMSPYLTVDATSCYANQVWIGDHMIHDVEVMNDCFDNVEWGAPVRVRFSAMLDFRSRLFVGGSWCWEGSSRAIAACMRRGISRYGPPEHLYVDNGKDYRKISKGALPGYLVESPLAPNDWWQTELNAIEATGFLARLGIAVTHCLPHHPQSKKVERAFGTVHERFDKLWPTYTSGNPFTRPDSTTALMMQHRRLAKAGRATESHHPLASQLILACVAWIEEYNATPQNGQGMDGGTPRQVFEANLNPRQKPAPELPTLAMLMAERESRLVRECAVTLRKRRYVPIDQHGWALMHERNERSILVAYDTAYLDNVAALDAEGNFLAWLEVEQLNRFAPSDPATQDRIADSMATRRHLEKGTRETIAAISRGARQLGIVTPLEAMASRLKLPAGETGADIITQRKAAPKAAKTTQKPMTPAAVARMLLEEK
jgi:putative transposase